MIRELPITDTFTVPIEIATRKTSIVAKSDSGKSYALRRILECIVRSGFAIPGAMIDPLGVAYGVRYGPDGESAGLPVPIFGGSHGDMPITLGSGPKIARALIESRTIGILDLSALDDDEQLAFVRDFVRAAGGILSEARQPFWLGADEADLFAPETPAKGQVECQRAMRYYCRRVRNFGGGYTFATQSTSVIDKKVVGQSDLIIAMHITSPTDQKPVIDWLTPGVGATRAKEITRELASFQKGDAVFYSPAWLKKVERAHISRCETFDSSKTPEIGEVLETVGRGATIDMAKLAASLQEETEPGDDLEALRAEIADLKRQLRERPEPQTVEKIVTLEPERAALAQIAQDIDELATSCVSALQTIENVNRSIRAALLPDAGRDTPKAAPEQFSEDGPVDKDEQAKHDAKESRELSLKHGNRTLTRAERALLTVLARHPNGRTKAQLSVLSGYSSNSSSFANALGALRSAGYVERGSDPIRCTAAGRKAVGPFDAMPTGSNLRAYWLSKLGKAERSILTVLISAYPHSLSKGDISARSGYSQTSSSFANALGKLRTLELIGGYGQVKASESLFE